MEDYKEKFIKLFWEYAPYLPTIFLVAGAKFFYSKVMGRKLGFWGHFFSYCLTVAVGLLIVPLLKNIPETYRYGVLILGSLLARDLITWIFSNWQPWWEYILHYKKRDTE